MFYLLILSGLVFIALSIKALSINNILSARTFSFLMLALGIYSMGYFFQVYSQTLETFGFWLRFQFLGIVMIAPLWLIFVLQYTDRSRMFNLYRLVAIFLIPVITLLLVWTNHLHGWAVRDIEIISRDGMTLSRSYYGPWFLIHTIYTNFCLLVANTLLLTSFFRSSDYHGKRFLYLFFGSSIPWAAYLLDITNLGPVGFLDLTPFGLVIAALIVSKEFFGMKLFRVLPVARAKVFDHIREGIIVLTEEDEIADMNEAARKLLGINHHYLGKPFDSIMELCLEQNDSGKVIQYNDDRKECLYKGKGQGEKWLEFQEGKLKDTIGPFNGKIITVIDIDRRKKSEEALKNSETRYRNLFENANMGILQFTIDGKIENANKVFLEIFGFDSLEELQANGLFSGDEMIVLPKDLKELFRKLKTHGRMANQTISARKKDGKSIWLDVNARISEESYSERPLIEVFCQDITDRMRSQELEKEMEVTRKASEAKDLFLANMSHEIRTPVTGIIGMADILSRTKLDENQEEYLNTINESSEILLKIINNILDISRIEAGKLELYPEVFSLKDLLHNISLFFEPNARQQGLQLLVTEKTTLPELVRTDKGRLKQVMINLISNAFKFTKEGSIEIKLSVKENPAGDPSLTVEVCDTGIGIAPEGKNKLFKKFEQLDNAISKQKEGTGLGLFISKELVKLLGGGIGVESQPGLGSTFWFTIPVQKVSSTNDRLFEREVDFSASFKGLRILLVDDKVVNQKVISIMLESLGCEVDLADNGMDALENFQPGLHRLIFMDIMMPGMDGIATLNKLKEDNPKTPPVIALTANAMVGDEEFYINKGFHDYLAKPVTQRQLIEKLFKWIAPN